MMTLVVRLTRLRHMSASACWHTARRRFSTASSTRKERRGSSFASASAKPLLGQVVTSQANFVRVLVEPSSVQEYVASREWTADDASLDRSNDDGSVEDAQRSAALSAVTEGRVELLCVVRALLKKLERKVLVGDFVSVSDVDWVQRSANVTEVHARTSAIREPPLANCNHVLLMFSVVQPTIEEAQLVRFLVTAEASGLPVTLALNKADLADADELNAWKERVAGWGYGAFGLSLATGEGVDSLAERLRGRYSLVAGPSGVGKSSLINALKCAQPSDTSSSATSSSSSSSSSSFSLAIPKLPEPSLRPDLMTTTTTTTTMDAKEKELVEFAPQAVSHVSLRNGRGRHTTRNVTLLQLPTGGLLADTPGFSYPSIEDLDPKKLANYFPEIRRAIEQSDKRCTFANCSHTVEPGCVVGTDWDRYENYCTLLREVRQAAKDQKRRGRREERVKHMTRAGGVVGVEARLDGKHRRRSRRQVRQSDMKDAMDLLQQEENDEEEEEEVLDWRR
ncbi:small ribosomal subunit biogenesis GTPase RsgA [Pycnococcus provasolii]